MPGGFESVSPSDAAVNRHALMKACASFLIVRALVISGTGKVRPGGVLIFR